MSINITLDTHIRFNPEYINENVLEEIFSQLRIDNPRKILAEREMLWGAEDLPDYIELWKYSSHNEIEIPRGFIYKLENILGDNNYPVNWIDKSISYGYYHTDVDLIILRDYQTRSVEELAIYNSGIYSAPTGSGKTRVMLELIRTLKQKTLVICEKKDIQQQWIESCEELGFGDDIGVIGNGTFYSLPPITVALRQSLISKTDQKWINEFGCVVVDEVHHCASADTLIDLVQRFPARYRFGCSATPDADPDLFPIAEAVIGPVITENTVEEIGEHLVIPSVKVIDTEFDFPYRPTFRQGNKVIRNNYNSMCNNLEEDEYRNSIISNQVLAQCEKGHHCLVISKRKTHIKEICKSLPKNYQNYDGLFSLTGDNSDQYNSIKNYIEDYDGGTITFTTLADEGTDIPIWDRLFLAYPGRKLRGYEQAIGRIMRPHSRKKDAIVYDFRDIKVPLLNSQYRFRAQNIYHKKNYKVESCE